VVGTRVSRASAVAAITRGIGVPGWPWSGVHAGDAAVLPWQRRGGQCRTGSGWTVLRTVMETMCLRGSPRTETDADEESDNRQQASQGGGDRVQTSISEAVGKRPPSGNNWENYITLVNWLAHDNLRGSAAAGQRGSPESHERREGSLLPLGLSSALRCGRSFSALFPFPCVLLRYLPRVLPPSALSCRPGSVLLVRLDAAVAAMANSRYEYVKFFEKDDSLLPNTWIVVRIDGRGFHGYPPSPDAPHTYFPP